MKEADIGSEKELWGKEPVDGERVRHLAQCYGISLLDASILTRRQIPEEELCFFLEKDLWYLHNSFLLNDMDVTVKRILKAVSHSEKLLIFGDRDVDGVASTVVLLQYLISRGLDVSWDLPKGQQLYGLSVERVERFAQEGGTLLILVDCGTTQFKEIAYAAQLGIDVLVLDHHQPRENNLPKALAVVNPCRVDSLYPFKGLSGAGVVLKTLWALEFTETPFFDRSLCCLAVEKKENSPPLLSMVRMRHLLIEEKCNVPLVEERLPEIARFIGSARPILYGPFSFEEHKLLSDIIISDKALDLRQELVELFPSLEGKTLKDLYRQGRICKYRRDFQLTPGEWLAELFSIFFHSKYSAHFSHFLRALDLVALSSVADLVTLRDENRILVRRGLALLERSERSSLRELFSQLRVLGRKMDTARLAWEIIPVMNSPGRLGEADLLVQLLLSESPPEQKELTKKVIALNKRRRRLADNVWHKQYNLALESLKELDGRAIFLEEEELPRGVTGILASRFSKAFDVPAIMLSPGEKLVSGSVRCSEKYKTKNLLDPCASLFLHHGGHDQAAGFSLKRENLSDFRTEVKKVLKKWMPVGDGEKFYQKIDAEIPSDHLTPDSWSLLDRYEPYGQQFLPFLFLTSGVLIRDASIVGVNHLRLVFEIGLLQWPAIFFEGADFYGENFEKGDRVDVVYQMGRKAYQARDTKQLVVRRIRKS